MMEAFENKAAMPKVKIHGVGLVRDKDGRPRFSDHQRANPQDIHPDIWDQLTDAEKKELLNGTGDS